MSCGCGGKQGLPLAVQARLEVARIVIGSGITTSDAFDTMIERVRKFVIADVDLDAIATPQLPVAIGDSADAVTSRNAFVNGIVSNVAALTPVIVAKLRVAGVHSLGQLVQWDVRALSNASIDAQGRSAIDRALKLYGLALAMKQDEVRDWIVKGPAGLKA